MGDVVNTAAWLESAPKELEAPLVVSHDTAEAAGLTTDRPTHELPLRGHSTMLPVYAVDLDGLRQLALDGKAAPVAVRARL